MATRRYPSDLRDREWALLEPLLPAPLEIGRPRTVELREVINAILYVLWTGCQWRALPREYPHWNTVYGYVRRWRQNGTWEWLHDQLRRQLRSALGRSPEPSAGSVDSQSVPTTERGGPAASTAASTSRAASATS
jgi:putative transposase